METYNGQINEFIDWVTGDNYITGLNETNGLKVSGGSIRQLIQDRLKNPFVLKEDVDNNLYRMFSSESAYQMWLENPSDNANLELFNFVRPSDYKLTITMNSSNRYVRYGDSSNISTRILFSWDIRNNEGESSDSLATTYSISSDVTGKTTSFTRWYSKGLNVDFSIYEYLEPGINTVTISGRGSTTGARNSVTFNIILLQLNVTSSFNFTAKHSSNDQISIPCTFTRNDQDGYATINFVIDAGENQKTWQTNVLKNTGSLINAEKRIELDLPAGLHTLQIWAEALYNDGTVTIMSNLLYFTFVIATDEISVQKYICIATSFDSGVFPITNLVLLQTQYLPQLLRWGYYTDAEQTNTLIPVVWKLYENEETVPQTIASITAQTREEALLVSYVPTIYSQYDDNSNTLTFLSAEWNDTQLIRIPVQIIQSADISVYETGAYSAKLSAYGKSNSSSDRTEWEDSVHNISTTFTNIKWNPNSGWYNNSFRTAGSNEYATIGVQPFSDFDFDSGKTIEIEFETEKVSEDTDKLIIIGNPIAARIEITPTKASLYGNDNKVAVYTNYKTNERIKLAFIINSYPSNQADRTVESGLAYIINNGILERAGLASGSAFKTSGNIQIGGSNSGVRVYNIRIYDYAITYTDAYNNYVYDSDDKIQILNDNDILGGSGEINYDLCKNKLDTILISGDLTNILSGQTDKDLSTTDVTIERTCPYDTTKNFKINGVQIRKHGQSTLNYPITSMKFWLNKSKQGVQPVFEISPQDKYLFNKNRYRMKDSSIPANKFVLLANYADSSGVHNGGIERLIQQSWFNAKIDGEYKLRTIPQLFTTDQTVTHTLAEINDVDSRIDGLNEDGHSWGYYSPNVAFPYQLRNSPDSFPCVVFYYNTAGSNQRTFLGQYVFMDDKKSDFLYGERSIYKIPSDPFCLTVLHAKDDTKANKVWDNGNVLRIEVLESNNPYSSYMTTDGFTTRSGNRYGWESAFELIYPDSDDLEEDDAKNGLTKFDSNSKYATTITPFINWYTWLVSTRNNQQKFQQEAAQHLDLYKLAAYYIFVLRLGLVDSLERNAQIKTYDGVHFHYEPWDMDIALGNKNDGGIAYEPPIDRNTKLPGSISTYAYSGKSANDSGQIVTSNWLFDALEAWPYWINTIVPKVAQALYDAGFTYDNISSMFDDNYASAWCENIYNKSGFFKYIESGNGDPEWLGWLQGARMTHRHWWLSTSMDYYDAKWFCGDYKNHYIYITANVPSGSGAHVTVIPNKSTYMTVAINYMSDNQTEINTDDVTVQGTRQVTPSEPLIYEVPNLNTKAPFFIYGANFMDTIDLSEIATGLDAVDVNGVYSNVLGSPLRTLNIGVPITQNGSNYTATVATLGGSIRGSMNALKNLQTLNIRGQRNFTDLSNTMKNYDLAEVQNVYAMGSGITNFYSSESGNNFIDVELPDTVSIVEFNNSTWQNLSFWKATIGLSNDAIFEKVQAPNSIQTLRLLGTTCQNLNSINLVRDWINSIVANEGVDALKNHTLEADKIYWTADSVGGNENLLTYDELELISQLNGDPDPNTGKKNHPLKGYIVLKNENGTTLTTTQLNNIKNWFGDAVFSKSSSGLVVDHLLNYTQINVGGDIRITNGEIYINEGGRASLNATRFALAETNVDEGIWTVSYAHVDNVQLSSTGITERRMSIISVQDTVDGITYLQTSESQLGGLYDIKVWYTYAGQTTSVVIHVVGVTYPDNVLFTIDNKATYVPRISSDGVIVWTNGIKFETYIDINSLNFTADLQRIVYQLPLYNSTLVYDTSEAHPDRTINIGDGITLDVYNGAKGFVVGSTSVPVNDDIIKYRISATLYFKSGKTADTYVDIIVMDDPILILSTNQPVYNAISNRWLEKYGEALVANGIYRSNLINLDGTLTFDSTLSTLTTSKSVTVLKYLPNINGLVFDNCTNLTNILDNIQQTDFSAMNALTALSIVNCTGLTADINLTNCININTVDARGTTINILLPENSKITTYKLGTPTSINISNPTQLSVSGISVDNSDNILYLTLLNIPNVQSYNTFAKIMNIS